MSNVLAWKTALDNGFEPRHYPYAAEDVPIGDYEAILDCKIWAKNTMGISCYFSSVCDGKTFRLTVFRRKEDEVYSLPDGDLDFKDCPVTASYQLKVVTNKRNIPILKEARLLA